MSNEIAVNVKFGPKHIALMAATQGDVQTAMDMIIAGLYSIVFHEPDDETLDRLFILMNNVVNEAQARVEEHNNA